MSGCLRRTRGMPHPTSMSAILSGMRHTQIHDPHQYRHKKVLLVGVGTIGSHLALTLGRMQVPLIMYDGDTIEAHNLATQSYTAADIEKTKVGAVLEQLNALGSGIEHVATAEHYAGKVHGDIIVSAVDSLDARRAIAQVLIEEGCASPIIDGRVGREQVEVYYFPTAAEWLAQLPEVGDEDPCGARFTAYTANIAAGLMANNVKRLLMNQEPPSRIIYDAATSIFIKE